MLQIGLSNKKKLPVVKLYDWTFAPWEIQKIRWTQNRFKKFSLTKDGDSYDMVIYGRKMKLLRYHAVAVVNELEEWEKCYIPISVKDKVVLDVGSGCGETALLFLNAGAKKVFGIESNREAYELALQNAERNNLNFEAVNEPFRLDHLKIPRDFLKMDIEGGESLLLENKDLTLGPTVLESHSPETTDALSKSFGFVISDRLHEDTWILTNVKKA